MTAKINTKRARLAEEILHRWDDGQPIALIASGLSCGQNTVRRLLDDRRPGERLSRSTPVVETSTKTCAGCRKEMTSDRFPFRKDRPGKRHARCDECQRDWRRGYQRMNPERNREGVRRRRARLRKARTQSYRDAEVHVRDEGLCCFCKQNVDITLRHPDPKAMVINHLHPIAKMGPDIAKNVAIAHYDCNHQAKDRYDSPFLQWAVSSISVPEARRVVIANHYLHRAGPISYAFGLFDVDDRLRGVVAFGSPSSMRITRSVTDQDVKVLELNRLWIDDAAPFGAGSFFLSRSLKRLPAAIIVSYADTEVMDPRYGTTHSGAIYRACSFHYSGTSRPTTEWRMPGGSRNVGKKQEGAIPVHVSPKARYWTVTGGKAEKKHLRKASKWPVLIPAEEPSA